MSEVLYGVAWALGYWGLRFLGVVDGGWEDVAGLVLLAVAIPIAISSLVVFNQ